MKMNNHLHQLRYQLHYCHITALTKHAIYILVQIIDTDDKRQ